MSNRLCKICKNKIPLKYKDTNEKVYNLQNRKNCLTCVPFKTSKGGRTKVSREHHSARKRKNSSDFYYRYKEKHGKIYTTERSAQRKNKILELLGNKCMICGYSKTLNNLCFHHVNPKVKKFILSRHEFQYSFNLVIEEIKKCILVCMNCHGEIHANMIDDVIIKDLYVKTLKNIIFTFDSWNSLLGIKKELKSIKIDNIYKSQCQDCQNFCTYRAKRCDTCQKKHLEKIEWPSDEELLQMVNDSSFLAVAKKLKVSDNAIRKRLKVRGLLFN